MVDGEEKLTPCSPGDQGAVEMTWVDVDGEKLLEPPLTVKDFIRAIKASRPTVSGTDLQRNSEVSTFVDALALRSLTLVAVDSRVWLGRQLERLHIDFPHRSYRPAPRSRERGGLLLFSRIIHMLVLRHKHFSSYTGRRIIHDTALVHSQLSISSLRARRFGLRRLSP